jgi:hypothetical protein
MIMIVRERARCVREKGGRGARWETRGGENYPPPVKFTEINRATN